MEIKPTNRKPIGDMGKKLEKQFSNNLKNSGVNLEEVDSMLSEKEQSFKKKFWDLPKMESLVHSDPILSAEYQEMSEDGQEKYGYHYNETIMNMLFNKYVTNDQGYQQKYLNAIPAKKERRDKTGINQLQQKGEEKMEKKSKEKNENNVPIHNNSLEGVIEEEMMDNNLNTNGGGTFDDREYLNHRINKRFDTMEENTNQSFSNDFASWFTSTSLCDVQHPKFGKHKVTPEQIKYSPAEYKNALFACIKKNIDNGTITQDMIAQHSNMDETTGAASSGAYAPALGSKAKNNVYEGENDLNAVKEKARQISKEEGVAQHVNDRGNGNYQVSDWFDSDTTIASFENGRPINEGKESDDPCWDNYKQVGMKKKNGKEVPNCVPEGEELDETTTSASSGAYATKTAWASGKSRHSKKPAWDGGEIVSENYLIDSSFFKKLHESVNSDSIVGLAEDHINTREEKIQFILDYGKNKFGDLDMLNHQDDETIDQLYHGVENALGALESMQEENMNEKSASKNQQQFMGMVHAYKKGEMPNASDSVKKAAESMSDVDALDFASTKHKGLPTKVDEDQYTDRVIKGNEALQLANQLDNAPSEEEENIINNFLSGKEISINNARNMVMNIIDSKYRGSESPDFFKLQYLVTIMNDMMDQDIDVQKQKDKDAVKRAYERTPHGKAEMEKNIGMGEGIISGTEGSIIGDNPTTMAATMKDVNMGGMGESEEVEFDGENSLGEFGKSNGGFGGFNDKSDGNHPNFKEPEAYGAPRDKDLNKYKSMTEGKEIVDEDGHCRKDEIPVEGKSPNEEGSCKKKNRRPSKEKTISDTGQNKYNEKFKEKREKEKEKKLNDRFNDLDSLEKNKKHMKKLKEMIEGKEIFEDKRPSALIQMDRLQKDNEKNFKSDMKDSNTADVAKGELTAKEQVEEVPENPYELGEKIEKEKQKEHKFASFDNIGNSTNDNNKEIPKRNATDDESEEIMLNRGLGMQDIIYDNEPDKRFEERMKKDMGETIYKQRQEKMDYRAKAPMYNKDTQPTDNGQEKDQFDKNINGYNSRKGVNENQTISGKYRDEFGNRKVISFNVSEAIELDKPEGVQLTFDGMGNTYTQRVTENTEMRDLINKYNYFMSGGKIVKVKSGKQSLTENNNTKKPVNEQIQKMMRLSGYDPSKHLNTSNTKKNRGF